MRKFSTYLKLLTFLSGLIFSSANSFAGGGFVQDGAPAIWSGIYAGGHIGGTFTSIDAEGEDEINPDGFTGGVHVGYNFQNGKTVYGIEGDFSWTGGKETYFGDVIQQNYLASIRGRLGYALDNTLLYATGGIAWTEFEVKGESPDFDFTGYVLGAGVEHKLSKNLSIKGEALHYRFDDEFDGDDIELNSTVLRAGLSWNFN